MAMRVVKAGELYSTFIYDGKDCADMGIYNVTSGAVYTMNIEPNYNDKTLEVPAYDGKYYYGTQITGQQFVFNCFCHDLSSKEYNKMRAWLNPRKVGRLILSDQRYKYYYVKPISVSNLSAYPVTSIHTPPNTLRGTLTFDDVVYTGNFTVTFETVGSAYGYGITDYDENIRYDGREYCERQYYYDSGLLYNDMAPALNWKVPANTTNFPIPMYNPGSAEGQPRYWITPSPDLYDASNFKLQFRNLTTGSNTIVDLGSIDTEQTSEIYREGLYEIDMQRQVVTDINGVEYYGRFTGTPFRLSPAEDVIEIPATFVPNFEEVQLVNWEDIGTGQWEYAQKDNLLLEYNSFTISNNVVTINPQVFIVSEDLVGRTFCVLYNRGAKILSVDIENNTLTLDSFINPQTGQVCNTYDISGGEVRDGQIIRPSGFAFNYIGEYTIPNFPELSTPGNVIIGSLEGGEDPHFYVYMYGSWLQTDMFASTDEFKDEFGNYITIYRNFGATILDLDELTVTSNCGADLYLNAEMTVRYL